MKDQGQRKTAVSLFASGGIGELGLKAAGIDTILANELIGYRAALHEENHPAVEMLTGDIWDLKHEIINRTLKKLGGRELFLVYATPPCQGMSSNGAGKLRSEIEAGRRHEEDPRNRLIIPTMDIACELRPEFVILENVPQMRHTVISNEDGRPEAILDYIQRRLGPEYLGTAQVIECEKYGIPQKRTRLITIYTRNDSAKRYFMRNSNTFFSKDMQAPPISLREAIADLPPLDAKPGRNQALDFHPQHRVPVMAPTKYEWIAATPEGATAFSNQCSSPKCGHVTTPGHKEELVDGRWRTSRDIPIDCAACAAPLPRPTLVTKDGRRRAIRGFHSSYRRMRWDQPARALTQNFLYEASDNKVHPEQNRVLSAYEAMVIQTISRYAYVFTINGADLGLPRIAEVIGESVPPFLIEKIAAKILSVAVDVRDSAWESEDAFSIGISA